jgi:hypothetical protein
MLPLALLAVAAAGAGAAPRPPVPQQAIVRQASASVRIIAGARVSAREIPDIAIVNDTKIVAADGSKTPARLVEFP